MEQYGKILLIAMPLFLIFVLFEKWYGWKRGKDTFRNMDMISSLSSGITNVVKDVLGLSISILTYTWMLEKVALVHLESTFLVYFIAFIVLDFQGYWVHRWAHKINILWNKHAIHHSSEDFNLACALRQSISSFVNLFTFFLLPAALLGVPAQVIGIVAPLHLFAQFWYHTEHIGKMGFWEYLIVTPSQHRVHHAMNPEYMDKNFGQVLSCWDRLFGSFQEEMPDVPPVYGITRPANTWNPIKINFQHLWLLIKDAYHAQNWWDKLRIWFMPTGWRPADVEARFPVKKVENVYAYPKYHTPHSAALGTWAWVQISVVFVLLFYYFGNLAKIGSPAIFAYGAFIFLSIYAYTELMDLNPFAFFWESLKNAIGLYCIWSMGDWFGSSQVVPGLQYLLAVYFLLSFAVTGYFVFEIVNKPIQNLSEKNYSH